MLSILLTRDVHFPVLLIIGTFTSLLLLEMTRLISWRLVSGMSNQQRNWLRLATTLTAILLTVQLLVWVHYTTPPGSPLALFNQQFPRPR